jgi:hypothetical protein
MADNVAQSLTSTQLFLLVVRVGDQSRRFRLCTIRANAGQGEPYLHDVRLS